MATASRFNRAYTSGLAAGSQPGGGFGSSFQSSFQSSMAAPAVAQGYGGQAPQTKPQATSFNSSIDWGPTGQPAPWQAPPPAAQPAPDMVNMFGPAPRPSAAQGYGGQAPPPGLGQPAPLPFGGFRARGGPVMPGQAYMVGERGPELIVPQQPGMVVPNGALPMESRIAQSPMNRGYGGGLADLGPVPVGRGMTPGRRMEMFARRAWTRGDEGAAMGITGQLAQMDQRQQMQQQGMDFAAKQNETNFQQGLMMQGMQQGAQFQRDEMQRQQQLDDWQRNQAAAAERDQANFQQGLTMFGLNQGAQAMEAERQRQQQEQDRLRVPNISVMPVPNTDYVMPTADGRVMGTLPVSKPDAPLPPGMAPMQATRGGVQYGMPQPGKPVVPQVKEFKTAAGVSEYREYDAKSGGWRKVKFIDENNDGVDDRTQGAAAPTPATPSKFADYVTRLMGGGK